MVVQFPVHLITLTLTKKHKLFKPEQLAEFCFIIQQTMRSDIRQANKRDLKVVQSALVRDYIRQQANERVKQMSELRPGVSAPPSNPQVINQ